MEQQLAYCTTSDGVRIAYATYGNDDAPPLLHLPEVPGQEAIWASPWGRAFFQEIARHRRLITLDPRGGGGSQPDAIRSHPEVLLLDVAAAVEQLRLDRFEVFAGGPVCCMQAVMYAADCPERVSKLVLFSPTIASSASVAASAEAARVSYPVFLRALSSMYFPSGPLEAQRWLSATWRASISAENTAATLSWTYDLAPILPRLTAPVLILHRKLAQIGDPADVRAVASLIPGARLVTLDGDAAAPYWDHDQFIDILYEFLGIGARPTLPGERSAAAPAPLGTAIILFTDIADSTSITERLGDAAFRNASRQLDARLRTAIADAGGSAVEGKLLGDGVMAVFPSARQAIDAARACGELSAESELPLHIGVHAGDVISEGTNVYGGAVNIASRICGLCPPGEILVSQTVRDLARTSAGVLFEDRGDQLLKGVEDAVRVFAIRPASNI